MLAVIATLGGVAHAHRPMIRPRIVRECPQAASWPLLLACFKDHKLVATPIGTLDDAKLLSITDDGTHGLEGFAIYVGRTGEWHLGGLLGQGGDEADFNLLKFEHVGRSSYRVDLASTLSSSATVDGTSSVPSVYRQISAAFCNGFSFRCMQVVARCEQIVRGQTIMAYEGTITVHDNTLSVKGAATDPSCGENVEEAF